MRDEATYRLALVHRAQNKPELAVPLLIQIIRSQQPTRDLGKKAYQQLLELGFVDSPFPLACQQSTELIDKIVSLKSKLQPFIRETNGYTVSSSRND